MHNREESDVFCRFSALLLGDTICLRGDTICHPIPNGKRDFPIWEAPLPAIIRKCTVAHDLTILEPDTFCPPLDTFCPPIHMKTCIVVRKYPILDSGPRTLDCQFAAVGQATHFVAQYLVR